MIGFIGAGNMARAIITGIVKSSLYAPDDIIVSDKNIDQTDRLKADFGIKDAPDNVTVAANSDILVLAVKPQILYLVAEEIKKVIPKETVVVSIAAGQSLERLADALGKKTKIIRVMPNTPALVGESMSALSPNENITEEEYQKVLEIFQRLGKAELVPEHLMDAVTAVSGSSPAYCFMMIEAMADAAVAGGMTRASAYTFAAQAMLGAAKMVLKTNIHPAELKDMVCSPGGTTIAAVKKLEEKGFRSAIMEAMEECIKKSRSM